MNLIRAINKTTVTRVLPSEIDYAETLRAAELRDLRTKYEKAERILFPYVDEKLRNALLNKRRLTTDIQEKDIAVIFTDLRGFTNMTLRTEIRALSNLLNNYYDIIIEHTHSNNGMVDKFMGDGAMCLFGAVTNDDKYIENAVKAAQDILRDFRDMIGDNKKHLALGIGVAAGPAVVGTFGNGNYVNFTALGPTVNLAARIQGLATGRDILCNEAVSKVLEKDEVKLKGSYELKGINKKSKVYYISY